MQELIEIAFDKGIDSVDAAALNDAVA